MTNINRRGFLFGSAAAAALAGCATAKVGKRVLKPGERRHVALIGCGIQGRGLVWQFLDDEKCPGVDITGAASSSRRASRAAFRR